MTSKAQPTTKNDKKSAVHKPLSKKEEELAVDDLSDGPGDDQEFEDFDGNDFENQAGQSDAEPVQDEFDDISGEADEDVHPEGGEETDEHLAQQKRPELLEMEKQIMEADVEYLNSRTQEVLEKLSNSKTVKLAPGERVTLLIELRKLFCRLFNYNDELMDYIMSLFSPQECYAFLEMMETHRPVTIRVNSLKTQKAALVKSLTERGVNLEPLDQVCKMAFKINQSKVPVGATPEYLAGHYMLQSAASMLPVRALAPQPGEFILDMAAAPGGKTTHIGQIMKNKGVIIANDFKKDRVKALFYNCQRMGLNNVIITNFDGRKFPTCVKKFDRVLLDAPCTGLGVISRDQSIKVKRNMLDIYKAAHLQKELLRKAIDLCKVGGYVVYSTCSFAVEENEAVVDYVCKKRYVKLVDTGLEIESKVYTKFKEYRFNDRTKYCVRVFPHTHNLDGFFVAKLLKVKDGIKGAEEEEEKVAEAQGEEEEQKDGGEAKLGRRQNPDTKTTGGKHKNGKQNTQTKDYSDSEEEKPHKQVKRDKSKSKDKRKHKEN